MNIFKKFCWNLWKFVTGLCNKRLLSPFSHSAPDIKRDGKESQNVQRNFVLIIKNFFLFSYTKNVKTIFLTLNRFIWSSLVWFEHHTKLINDACLMDSSSNRSQGLLNGSGLFFVYNFLSLIDRWRHDGINRKPRKHSGQKNS